MSQAAVLALQAHLESLGSDSTVDAADRVKDLRRFRMDLESLLGVADRLIGDSQLERERDAMDAARARLASAEDLVIAEELVRRGMVTAEDLSEARVGEELVEAFGAIDPAKLAAIAKKRHRDHGKFADEFGSPKAPKGRGGAAIPKGTPNTPGGSSAEATARARAAAAGGTPKPNPQIGGAGNVHAPGTLVSKPKRKSLGAAAYTPDKDGVHDVGSDVQAGADLLSQGKKIRLSQPREVSTLLTELAQRVQAAKAAGEKAPNFNLCQVSVPGTNLFCAESKGVERVNMPQLGGEPLPGTPGAALAGPDGKVELSQQFRQYLEDSGVRINNEEELASHLRPTQIELDGAKVAGMTQQLDSGKQLGGDPRLFVSADNYIVDGHHRWAANVGHDLNDGQLGDVQMPVARVDMDIVELIEAANRYSQEMGLPQRDVTGKAKPMAPKSPGTQPAAPAADPPAKAEADQAIKAMYTPEEAQPHEQTFGSLDELYSAAKEANDGLTTLLTEGLPDMLGATVPGFEEAVETAKTNPSQPQILMGPMKKRKRALEKIRKNYKGDHNKLQDVIRATVLVESVGDMPAALDQLRKRAAEQGWEIRGAEDKITDGPPPPWVKGPTSAGYSDTKVYLVSPNGVGAEVQINTNSMFTAKEGDGHKLYERQRSIEAAIDRRYAKNDALEVLKADPTKLPENGDLYFNTDAEALSKKYGTEIDLQDVPLDVIVPVRARPEGIANAKPLMAKAGLGEGGKRDPITLVRQPDDTLKVYDGNSTFAIASGEGWKNITAMVVDSDEEAAAIEKIAKEEKARLKAAKPAPPASPGTTGPQRSYDGPTADEITELNDLKARQKALYGEAKVNGYV